MLLSCSKIRLSWVLIPPQTDGISCTHTHKPRVRIIWKLNQRCFQILTSDWRWSETEGSIRSTHRALYSRLTWTLSIKTAAAGFIDVQFILYLTTGPRVHTVMHRYIHPREKLRHHSCIQTFGETSSLSRCSADPLRENSFHKKTTTISNCNESLGNTDCWLQHKNTVAVLILVLLLPSGVLQQTWKMSLILQAVSEEYIFFFCIKSSINDSLLSSHMCRHTNMLLFALI